MWQMLQFDVTKRLDGLDTKKLNEMRESCRELMERLDFVQDFNSESKTGGQIAEQDQQDRRMSGTGTLLHSDHDLQSEISDSKEKETFSGSEDPPIIVHCRICMRQFHVNAQTECSFMSHLQECEITHLAAWICSKEVDHNLEQQVQKLEARIGHTMTVMLNTAFLRFEESCENIKRIKTIANKCRQLDSKLLVDNIAVCENFLEDLANIKEIVAPACNRDSPRQSGGQEFLPSTLEVVEPKDLFVAPSLESGWMDLTPAYKVPHSGQPNSPSGFGEDRSKERERSGNIQILKKVQKLVHRKKELCQKAMNDIIEINGKDPRMTSTARPSSSGVFSDATTPVSSTKSTRSNNSCHSEEGKYVNSLTRDVRYCVEDGILNFKIGPSIGKGGFSEVFLAMHAFSGDFFAVKVVRILLSCTLYFCLSILWILPSKQEYEKKQASYREYEYQGEARTRHPSQGLWSRRAHRST